MGMKREEREREKEKKEFLPSFCLRMSSVQEKLYRAAEWNVVEELQSLLKGHHHHPDLDVNRGNESVNGWTALHAAAYYGHAEAVKLLLEHPAINVNAKNRYRQTPFSFACFRRNVSVVRLLLKDLRVDIALHDEDGCSPLWRACECGSVETIMWLMASGRDFGDMNIKGSRYDDDDGWVEYTALEVAREHQKTQIVSLLEKFIANPAQTRLEVRMKLGVLDEYAAEIFALTVFLCDDLLQPNTSPPPTQLPLLMPFASSQLLPRCPWSCRWCSAIMSLAQ